MQKPTKEEQSSGITDVPGFRAAGVHCDIRNKGDGRLDLALLVSDRPCTVAGVFTRNRMAAAPVRIGREQLKAGKAVRGVAVNSGNANACTGKEGFADALHMQRLCAEAVGCPREEMFVCSTGRIGQRLPMNKIASGAAEAAASLGSDPANGLSAADAILTSDTRHKVCTVSVKTSRGNVRVAGMAKGAGMIEPNMATMLAFLATDVECSAESLQDLLKASADRSFNAVTVDGDESTNDTVLLLANGASGIVLEPGDPDWMVFAEAVQMVCQDLAQKIVGDGEKITKVVEVCIESAATKEDAEKAARAVANSLLVKSSWYGNDPNWGRIMDALGYSGADLSEGTVQLWYAGNTLDDPVPAFTKGEIHAENKDKWKAIVSQNRFRIIADLGGGGYSATVWSTDLTEGYVQFNKSE